MALAVAALFEVPAGSGLRGWTDAKAPEIREAAGRDARASELAGNSEDGG
ncbi:MAG: hypothetical protein L0323_19740 [Planctomycetes bacterium]|nr:hypothetical protein [Planctomycetota bacterium]